MNKNELITILDNFRCAPAENEVFEFKEAKNTYDFSKIGKYFSALSNEANLKHAACAWLIFGIKDKGRTIVGSQFRLNRSDLDSLKGEIANKTNNLLHEEFQSRLMVIIMEETVKSYHRLISKKLKESEHSQHARIGVQELYLMLLLMIWILWQ